MKFLCAVLAFALAACGRADASTTDLPTLTVAYVQADSARIIATWRRPCDAKGCADAFRVQWTAGAVSRLRNTSALADTIFVARPAIGDSLTASVAVTALRRAIAGATRSTSTVVRNPDAPPPPVDELRTDTLSALAAEVDSFPVLVVRTPANTPNPPVWNLRLGDPEVVSCVMGRNRYTGVVRTFVPTDAPDHLLEVLDRACAAARAKYAAERAG